MTNEGAVAVLVRGVGIILALQIAEHLLFALKMGASASGYSPGLISALAIDYSIRVLVIVLATVMILRPMPIAGCLLPAAYHGEATDRCTVEEFQAVVFGALGVFLVLSTLLHTRSWYVAASLWSAVAAHLGGFRDVFSNIEINTLMVAAFVVADCAVGIWLIFSARGLGSLVRRARRAGLD